MTRQRAAGPEAGKQLGGLGQEKGAVAEADKREDRGRGRRRGGRAAFGFDSSARDAQGLPAGRGAVA